MKSHFVYLIEHFLLWVPGDLFHAVMLRKYFMHMRVNFFWWHYNKFTIYVASQNYSKTFHFLLLPSDSLKWNDTQKMKCTYMLLSIVISRKCEKCHFSHLREEFRWNSEKEVQIVINLQNRKKLLLMPAIDNIFLAVRNLHQVKAF